MAMFVATPMIASAVPYSDGSTTTKPTVQANTEVATTSYVKGAYDELAEAINTATSTANSAANQDLSNISASGQTVIDNRAVAKINDAAGTVTATSLTASNGVLTVNVDGTHVTRDSTTGALTLSATDVTNLGKAATALQSSDVTSTYAADGTAPVNGTAVASAISAAGANYDAAGSAATAEQNAKDYADGLASNYDASGSAATAEQNAKDYADSLASNYDAAGAATTAANAAEAAAKTYAAGMTLPVYGTWRTATSTGNATLTAPSAGN